MNRKERERKHHRSRRHLFMIQVSELAAASVVGSSLTTDNQLISDQSHLVRLGGEVFILSVPGKFVLFSCVCFLTDGRDCSMKNDVKRGS